MKKLSLSIVVALLITLPLTAQSQTAFPDGGFENCWQQFQAQNGNNYWDFKSNHFLSTLNTLYDITAEQGIAPLTAWRSTGGNDVYNGSYALKVASNTMIMGDETIFLPGVAATLEIDIFNIDCTLGEPFTSRPTSMNGYYKYAPVNGDSAIIEVFFQKNGNVIGGGKKVINDVIADWEQFDIDIDYINETTPDVIVVIFASSGNYDFSNIQTLMACKGQVGSTLYLDDVDFKYGTSGIKEMLTPAISVNVFPNPSTEQVTVQIGKEISGTLAVYDYLSRKVGEYPVNGTQISIDVNRYATGSYLLNVIENDKVITTGRFVKQ